LNLVSCRRIGEFPSDNKSRQSDAYQDNEDRKLSQEAFQMKWTVKHHQAHCPITFAMQVGSPSGSNASL
jgi:hypothetical protein